MPSNNTRSYPTRLWLIVKILISVGLLAYCLNLIDFSKFATLVRGANPLLLAAACGLVIVEILIGAYRFKLMLDCSHWLSFKQHAYQYFSATYFNLILPGSIGGDAARILWLGNCGVSRRGAIVLVFIERYIGLLTLILVAALATLWVPLPTVILQLIHIASGLGLASLLVLTLAYRYVRSRNSVAGDQALWLAACAQLFARVPRLIFVCVVSLAYQYATVGITYLVALSFNLPVTMGEILALVPLVWLAILVPISLGGLGLREASFIYLFALLGMPQEQALILSLGTYGVLLFGGLFGGLGFTWQQFRQRPA